MVHARLPGEVCSPARKTDSSWGGATSKSMGIPWQKSPRATQRVYRGAPAWVECGLRGPSGRETGMEASGMDFAFSQEQQAWHDAAVQFAHEQLVDDILGRDERREFWREGWRRCAGFGIQG